MPLTFLPAASGELYEEDRAWVRSFGTRCEPYATGAGLVDFIADAEEDR